MKIKFRIIALSLVLSINAPFVVAEESILCPDNYNAVKWATENIKNSNGNLSILTEKQLMSDLLYHTKKCISFCEGKKFQFCK